MCQYLYSLFSCRQRNVDNNFWWYVKQTTVGCLSRRLTMPWHFFPLVCSEQQSPGQQLVFCVKHEARCHMNLWRTTAIVTYSAIFLYEAHENNHIDVLPIYSHTQRSCQMTKEALTSRFCLYSTNRRIVRQLYSCIQFYLRKHDQWRASQGPGTYIDVQFTCTYLVWGVFGLMSYTTVQPQHNRLRWGLDSVANLRLT